VVYIALFMAHDVYTMLITQITHLLFFDCKIGDFKIAGRVCFYKKVCLPSLLQGIFWQLLKLCIENKLDGRASITLCIVFNIK